jgi:hypothetical protein
LRASSPTHKCGLTLGRAIYTRALLGPQFQPCFNPVLPPVPDLLNYLKPVSRLSQTCSEPVSKLPQTCSKHILNPFQPVSNMFQSFYKPVSDLFQTCLKPDSNLSQTCFKPVSNLFQAYLKPVSNLFQTCCKPISNMFQACLKPVPNLSKTCIIVPKPCHIPVPNLLQTSFKPVSRVLLFPSLPSVFIVELKASFPVSEDFKLSGEFFAVIFISCQSYKTFYSSPSKVWLDIYFPIRSDPYLAIPGDT